MSLNVLWHCLSLQLERKWTFPSPVALAEFSKFAGILSAALSVVQFSSVQSLSHVQLFATPWTAARQASLSITNSWTLLKSMSIESVMTSNYLIFCCPLLLPSIFPSIRVFSNELVLHIRWPKDLKFQLQHLSFQ